jgi:hypothetical protein
MTRSNAAFTFSCETLFRQYEKVYFWTFTCVEVHSDWRYGPIFHAFFRELQHIYGEIIQGIRVYELHKNHGIHWHCLLSYRISVRDVLRIGKKYGIGRVSVTVADRGAIGYMAKYLGKDKERLKGLSKWRPLGGFQGTKCKDIVIESPYHLEIKRLQKRHNLRQVPWDIAKYVMRTTTLRIVTEKDRREFDALIEQRTYVRGKRTRLEQSVENIWPFGGPDDGGGVDRHSVSDVAGPRHRASQDDGRGGAKPRIYTLARGSAVSAIEAAKN